MDAAVPAPGTLDLLSSTRPGSLTETSIPIGNLASGAPIQIPVIVARGQKPGPCLWINGQIHGDELNGVFAALDFVRGVKLAELSGTVIVTSTINPFALDARQRRTPHDSLDLDQSFPGHSTGSITERIAATIGSIALRHADYLVSLHTTMASFDAVVFAAYKTPLDGSGVSEDLMLRCMAQFRPVYVCVMPNEARAADATGHIKGSIDYQFLASGKLAFMIEIGGGGRCDRQHVQQAVEGLYGVGSLLGLLSRPALKPEPLIQVTEFRGITVAKGGLFRRSVDPGLTELKPGEAYGHVTDLYGHAIEVAAFDRPARLIAVRRDPVVHSGDRISIAALAWKTIDLA